MPADPHVRWSGGQGSKIANAAERRIGRGHAHSLARCIQMHSNVFISFVITVLLDGFGHGHQVDNPFFFCFEMKSWFPL